MRLTAALIAAVLIAPAAAGPLKPGVYPCRTPAGTVTGSGFVIYGNGVYGDAPGAVSGRTRYASGELRFVGGKNDGKFATVISATRLKIGKRIFCTREADLPKPVREPVSEETVAPAAPGAKLIVVKPGLRR